MKQPYGTEGNSGKNLINMLKYIEESTEENIVNQDIERIHNMVQLTKQKKEVGINYMKSWEWETTFMERGRAEGLEQGRFLLLCEMVQSGDISLERASRKMDLLPEKFADRMKEAGYV